MRDRKARDYEKAEDRCDGAKSVEKQQPFVDRTLVGNEPSQVAEEDDHRQGKAQPAQYLPAVGRR